MSRAAKRLAKREGEEYGTGLVRGVVLACVVMVPTYVLIGVLVWWALS